MDSGKSHEAISRRPRDLLKSYYGISDGSHGADHQKSQKENGGESQPCDINGSNFDKDLYLNKLLKEKTLTALVDKEQEMVKNIRTLDSDMQTLVYENYNKFISATDTIRKMKTDFRRMEEEMTSLTGKMEEITEFSGRISEALQDRRQQITKLSGVHTLLMKLQFLFDLPNKLQKCLEQERYAQAVRYHMKARKVLQQYQHMPSFQGIQEDCSAIVRELTGKLREQFRKKDCNPKQLTECVELLLQLNEPAEVLCGEFLSHAREKIDADLSTLELQLKLCETSHNRSSTSGSQQPSDDGLFNVMDVLEFVDCGCNGFLSNVCLVVASYSDMFLNRHQEDLELDAIALKRLVHFVNELIEKYFEFVRRRVQMEKNTGDNTILVRALDRFHRRLQAMNKLLPDSDFSRAGTELVAQAAQERVQHYLETLQLHLSDCLTDIRQSIASSGHPGSASSSMGGGSTSLGGSMGGLHGDGGINLGDMVKRLQASVVEQVKSVLRNLQAFIDPDVTFAMKHYFRSSFCSRDVRENLVVAYIRHIIKISLDFIEQTEEKSSIPSCLLLITSRLCLDLESSSISYLLTLVEEQFPGDDRTRSTSFLELASEARSTAQLLLNHYVKVQGSVISQMLRKSVETRDCLSTIEPRTVRAVMKRVVEDVTSVDRVVGQLFEEGARTERLSDSTARRSLAVRLVTSGGGSASVGTKSQWSYTPSTMDTSLMSNIQKLFYEKIEIFSPVDFNKVSVMTGIIKISLKTLLECVRLKTFGRYGLQQIQVDCHYLQLYLWRFVHDENLIHLLLDEIVSSTLHRCLDPVAMEASVVDLICERG